MTKRYICYFRAVKKDECFKRVLLFSLRFSWSIWIIRQFALLVLSKLTIPQNTRLRARLIKKTVKSLFFLSESSLFPYPGKLPRETDLSFRGFSPFEAEGGVRLGRPAGLVRILTSKIRRGNGRAVAMLPLITDSRCAANFEILIKRQPRTAKKISCLRTKEGTPFSPFDRRKLTNRVTSLFAGLSKSLRAIAEKRLVLSIVAFLSRNSFHSESRSLYLRLRLDRISPRDAGVYTFPISTVCVRFIVRYAHAPTNHVTHSGAVLILLSLKASLRASQYLLRWGDVSAN